MEYDDDKEDLEAFVHGEGQANQDTARIQSCRTRGINEQERANL
jgi:hypothetical protein